MVLIETSRWFEAAHRQIGDPGKCGYPHGHNWKVDIKIDCSVIDSIGYVVDFKQLYDIVDQYDHKMLLCKNDAWCEKYPFPNLMELPCNPTCEMLATLIKDQVVELVSHARHVIVVVWENDHSKATAYFNGDE